MPDFLVKQQHDSITPLRLETSNTWQKPVLTAENSLKRETVNKIVPNQKERSKSERMNVIFV